MPSTKPAPKGSPRRSSGAVTSNASLEASTQRRQQQPHGVYCQRAEPLQAQAPAHHARSRGGGGSAAAAAASGNFVVGEHVYFRIRRFAGAVQAWGTAHSSDVEGAEYLPRNGDKVTVVCPAKKVFIKLADAATGRYADDDSARESGDGEDAACHAVYVYPSNIIKVRALCGGGSGDSSGSLFSTRLEEVGKKGTGPADAAARDDDAPEFFLAKESAPAVAWWALRYSEVADGDVFALRCTVGAPRSVVLSDGRGPSVSLVLPPPEMRVDTSTFVPRLHGGAAAAAAATAAARDRPPALLGLPVFAGADEAAGEAGVPPPPPSQEEAEEEDHSRRVGGFLKGVRRGFAVAGEAGTQSALTHAAVGAAAAKGGGAAVAVEVSLAYDPISVVVYHAEERGAAARPAAVFEVKAGSTHPENLRGIVDVVVKKRGGAKGGSSRGDDGSSVGSTVADGDETADGGYVVLNTEGEAVTLVHGALLVRCAKRLTLEPEHQLGSDGRSSSGSEGASGTVRREMEGNPRDLPPLCLRKIVVEVCGEDATRSVRVACRAVGTAGGAAAAAGRFAEAAECVLGEVAEEALRALDACDAGATRCRGKFRLRGPRPPVDGAAYTLLREEDGVSPARGGRGGGGDGDAGTKCVALQMDGMTQVAELRSAQTPSQVQKAILAAVGVAAWNEVKVLAPSLTPSTLSYASAPPFIAFESRGEGGRSAVHS